MATILDKFRRVNASYARVVISFRHVYDFHSSCMRITHIYLSEFIKHEKKGRKVRSAEKSPRDDMSWQVSICHNIELCFVYKSHVSLLGKAIDTCSQIFCHLTIIHAVHACLFKKSTEPT